MSPSTTKTNNGRTCFKTTRWAKSGLLVRKWEKASIFMEMPACACIGEEGVPGVKAWQASTDKCTRLKRNLAGA